MRLLKVQSIWRIFFAIFNETMISRGVQFAWRRDVKRDEISSFISVHGVLVANKIDTHMLLSYKNVFNK